MLNSEILNDDTMLEVEFDAVFPSYGTTNYEELENKPSINGVTLEGNKTTQDLNIEIPDVSSFVTQDTDNLTNYYNKTVTDEKLQNKADNDAIPDVSPFITKDVNNLTNYELKTNTGNNIALSIDPATFVMTLNLKNSAGEVLSTGTVDLPLETMVVNANYDNTTKEIVLTLQNGNVLRFSVADLVSGLAKSSEVYTKDETYNKTEIDNKGFLTNESDPTVPSHVKNITEENITSWNNKSEFSGSYNDLRDKPADYVLPIASADTLGGVKIGENLEIDVNGVLSALGGGGSTVIDVDSPLYIYSSPAGVYNIRRRVMVYERNSSGVSFGPGIMLIYDAPSNSDGEGKGFVCIYNQMPGGTYSSYNRLYYGWTNGTKCASNSSNPYYLDRIGKVDNKQDQTANSLKTTSKNIVGAINEVYTSIDTKIATAIGTALEASY